MAVVLILHVYRRILLASPPCSLRLRALFLAQNYGKHHKQNDKHDNRARDYKPYDCRAAIAVFGGRSPQFVALVWHIAAQAGEGWGFKLQTWGRFEVGVQIRVLIEFHGTCGLLP